MGDRHDPAHGIKPGVKTADVSQKGGEYTHRDVIVHDHPDAGSPNHQNTQFSQQTDRGCEQRPGFVDSVVHFQIAGVGLQKTVRLSTLLCKGFHNTNTRNGVRKNVGDLTPNTVDLLKTRAQLFADQVNHPGNDGQRQQRQQSQLKVNVHQNDRCHHDHDHIGNEVERMQREKQIDSIGFSADTRDQITGAFRAEIVQRQAHQMVECGGSQIRADSLGDQGQQVGSCPTQTGSHHR